MEPVPGGAEGVVVVPEVRAHGPHPLGKVLEDRRAAPHVVGGDLVAPLGTVHDGAVGLRIVLQGIDDAGGDGGHAGLVVEVVPPAAAPGAGMGLEDPDREAPLLRRPEGVGQAVPGLGHVLGDTRHRHAESLVHGRVGIVGQGRGRGAGGGRDRAASIVADGQLAGVEHRGADDESVHAPRLPGVEDRLRGLDQVLQVPHHVHPDSHPGFLSPLASRSAMVTSSFRSIGGRMPVTRSTRSAQLCSRRCR